MRGLTQVPRAFWEALGLNFIWMNASETFRYFLVVKPMMRADFGFVPGITPNSAVIAGLWTIWDIVLILITTVTCWIVLERGGRSWRTVIAAATLVWASVFLLLWLGLHNMGLARPHTIAAALPLAWIELVIAGLLVRWRMRSSAERTPALVDA